MGLPSNTLLVEGTFPELAEELAQYLDALSKAAEGQGVLADIQSLLDGLREAAESGSDDNSTQKQKDDVLKKIITKAAVLNNAPERELTAAYNLLISLSSQSPMRDQFFARICQYLSDKPISSTQYGPSLAISTLTTIFNVLPVTSDARYHVFLAILKVIKSTTSAQAFDALIPQLEENISNWLSAWQLDDEDVRSLHVAVADVAKEMGNTDLEYKYLLQALETTPPAAASESDSQKLAKRTLILALTIPRVTDFTPLTASDAIQALRKSDSNLFELLEIFSSDDFSAYVDFLETNTLESIGIPESAGDVIGNKIRLLTLAGIAAASPTRSVPYSVIASSLQIPKEDVEVWVIDTIRAGLVEGKLSQLKQEFLVQRATYRVFGEKQWAEIQGRLMVWRRSLESVLTVVRSERERFAREGITSNDDRTNGYEGQGQGQRRQGNRRGGDRQQQQSQTQQREIDVAAD